MRPLTLLAVVLVSLRASAPAAAQQRDIILLADVSARSVEVRSQPRIEVRLCGGLDSVRVLERRNLPERVTAGTTYRDVFVSVAIFGRIEADRILATIHGASGARRDTTVGTPPTSDTTRSRTSEKQECGSRR